MIINNFYNAGLTPQRNIGNINTVNVYAVDVLIIEELIQKMEKTSEKINMILLELKTMRRTKRINGMAQELIGMHEDNEFNISICKGLLPPSK